MKKILSIIAFVAVALSFTGCGTSAVVSNNLTETKVVLSESNFKVVGQAYGEVTATYICGIGGLNKKMLRSNAIDEMSRNANLNGAQTITNVTVNFAVRMITPFYVELTCTATGNIVEFTK